MHDGGVLIRHAVLVDLPRCVLVEPDTHGGGDVVVVDGDVLVPVWQLVLVNQADGVADLVQVQTFLYRNKKWSNESNCLFVWLVGFSTSSSTTRLYGGRAPRQRV